MHLDGLISALLGSGITTALAKAFIGKSLREVEQVAEKISEIKESLAALSVKLDVMDKERSIILKHDRKIAAMENQLYGIGNGQSRKYPPVS